MLTVAIVAAVFVLPTLLKSKNREAQSRVEDRFSEGMRVLATQRSTRPVVADPLQTHRPQLLPAAVKGPGMKRPAIVDKRRAEKMAAFEELVAQRSARVASVNRWAAAYRYVFLAAVVALVASAIAAAFSAWPWWSAAASAVVAGFSVVAARQLTDRWVEEDKDLRAEIAQARQDAGVITSPRGTVRVPAPSAPKARGVAKGAEGQLVLPAQARAVAGGSESLVEAAPAGAQEAEPEEVTARASKPEVNKAAAAEKQPQVEAAEVAEKVESGPVPGALGAATEKEGTAKASVQAPEVRTATRPPKRGWTPRPVPEPTYARQPRLTRRVANPYESGATAQRSARHEGTPMTAADLREVERTLNGAARLEAETAQLIENVLERRRAVG